MKPSYYELFKTFTPPVKDLDDPVLDAGFVAEAREFERKIEEKEISDEEFQVEDRRLLDLFNDSHPIETDEPEDVKADRKKAGIFDEFQKNETEKAKKKISEAKTPGELDAIVEEITNSGITDIKPLIDMVNVKKKSIALDSRMAKISEKIAVIESVEQVDAFVKENEYEKFPEIVKLAEDRKKEIEKQSQEKSAEEKEKQEENQKPAPQDLKDLKTVEEKVAWLKSKKKVSFDQLDSLEIKHGGDDFYYPDDKPETDGVYLQQIWLFNAYNVLPKK